MRIKIAPSKLLNKMAINFRFELQKIKVNSFQNKGIKAIQTLKLATIDNQFINYRCQQSSAHQQRQTYKHHVKQPHFKQLLSQETK